MNRFRLLRADEIDCRISQIAKDGRWLDLLLYKDARCDMNILDETVGPMNWERRHSRENANCTVSIYDPEKEVWVDKEDTGTESNTEAAKGLASDSFKRACFNWGIGRELYTAPRIRIWNDKCDIQQGQNGKFNCYDGFTVLAIEYSDTQEIAAIVIGNDRRGEVAFSWRRGVKEVRPEPRPEPRQDTFVAKCADCGAEIDDRVHDYSVKKYKRPLCRNCQKKA